MTDKEKLEKIKKLADAMYYAAFNLTTDASRLHKAMDEYHQFIIHECKEEPVSEVWHEPIERPDSNKVVLIMVRCGYIGEPELPHLAKYDSHNNQYIDKDRTDVCNCPIVYHVDSVEKWAYIDDILNLSNVERTIKNWKEELVSGNVDFEKELYKAFGQVKDFTLGMQIAKRFYDMGRNSKDSQEPVSDDKLEGLRNAFRLALDDEEPISDELEEAAVEWFNSVKYKSDLSGTLINAFKAGAQWQKEKEYTCYEEAFEDGASWKKEQMMKGANDATVHIDAGGYPYIPQMELYDYDKDVPLAKEGDKYKVILIKEKEL